MNSENTIDDFKNEKIYLNSASTSLMPQSSINAMTDFLLEYNTLGPDSSASESLVMNILTSVRKNIAKLLCCNHEKIILTQSTTDGINAVANGIDLSSTSNIILRGMNHEHHANYYPWLRLARKIKIKNLKVDTLGFFSISDLLNKIDNNTKLIAISHALYNTGAILPIHEIGEILKKKNILYFLDAAQTIGCIDGFDVNKIKCDFVSFNGSKWLCGPMGTGIFYCNDKNLIEPTCIGGESVMLFNNNIVYKDTPNKFQGGFRNYVGMAGLNESLRYILNFGLQNIRNKIIYLANILRDELLKNKRIKLYNPSDPEKRTSIISFTIDGYEPQNVVEILEKKKIILAVREIFDKKIIRASPHFFNTENEIMKTISIIKQL